MEKEKIQPASSTEELIEPEKELVLYNDDYNTFDFVIETLIDICEHDPIQAEQCTIIVHFKGKCGVKSGSYNDLKPLVNNMLDKSLTVSIE